MKERLCDFCALVVTVVIGVSGLTGCSTVGGTAADLGLAGAGGIAALARRRLHVVLGVAGLRSIRCLAVDVATTRVGVRTFHCVDIWSSRQTGSSAASA